MSMMFNSPQEERICLIHGYNFGASQQIGICIDSVIHSTLAIDYDRRGRLMRGHPFLWIHP
ncbi:hypothetical protein V1478_004173 [Vespula squamosa]|uniref:Uncharacterized protein n=1 Tax=Vespula squamosa TaxID=30214 RepID=A0ABD2BK12_VESSQ